MKLVDKKVHRKATTEALKADPNLHYNLCWVEPVHYPMNLRRGEIHISHVQV